MTRLRKPVIAFSPTPALATGTVMYTYSPKTLASLGYAPKTIFIGSYYPTSLANVGRKSLVYGRKGVTFGKSSPETIYHPSHVSSLLSHESLHHALDKVHQEKASFAIDKRQFGGSEVTSPIGMLNPEILHERMLSIKAHKRLMK